MKISVVIPAYNEGQNITKLIKLLIKNFNRDIYEIIIVNDCSQDNTEQVLKYLSRKYKKLKPVNRRGDNGVGKAIKEGLNNVSSKATHVLLLDCDFLENTEDIKNIIKMANKGYDGILGSRYIKENLVNYPRAKKIANRGFHFIARGLLNISFVDVTNNFKLYKLEVVNKIKPLLTSRGFSINAETGIYPLLLGFNLKEVPVSWIGRSESMGTSNFQVLNAGPGYIKVLFKMLRFKYFHK